MWLGQEDQNTKDVFECARYIHENALGRREMPWKSLALFRSPLVSFANLSDSLTSLTHLTYTHWFERAWTFQEVILLSTVSLVCGDNSMPLEYLESCVDAANGQSSVPSNHYGFKTCTTLDFDVGYEIIPAGHPQRRSLAAFYDLPVRSHFS